MPWTHTQWPLCRLDFSTVSGLFVQLFPPKGLLFPLFAVFINFFLTSMVSLSQQCPCSHHTGWLLWLTCTQPQVFLLRLPDPTSGWLGLPGPSDSQFLQCPHPQRSSLLCPPTPPGHFIYLPATLACPSLALTHSLAHPHPLLLQSLTLLTQDSDPLSDPSCWHLHPHTHICTQNRQFLAQENS